MVRLDIIEFNRRIGRLVMNLNNWWTEISSLESHPQESFEFMINNFKLDLDGLKCYKLED